jgi:hypothetical protein
MKTSPRFGTTAGMAARRLVPSVGSEFIDVINRKLGQPFFNLTLTDFLAGTMLVDIVALWLPRAWNALFRGAMDYKPSEDLTALRKQGLDKTVYVAKERFKRLNWPNFIEECGREFASGPGFFIWPTIVLSGIALHVKNIYKTGLHLAHGEVSALCNQYQTMLGNHTIKTMRDTGDWSKSFQKLIHNVIDKPALLARRTDAEKRAYETQLNHVVEELEQSFAAYRNDTTPWIKRIGNNIKRWWTKAEDMSPLGRVEAAQAKLTALVEEINARRPFGRMMLQDKLPVHKGFFTNSTITMKDKTGIELSLVDIGEANKDISRWYDVHHALKNQVNSLPKGFTDASTMGDLVTHAEKRLMRSKAGYMAATVAVTIGFLFKLVTWTQHHDSYVANRNLDLVGRGNTGSNNPNQVIPSRNNPTHLMNAFQRFASSPMAASNTFEEAMPFSGDTFAGNPNRRRTLVTSGGQP